MFALINVASLLFIIVFVRYFSSLKNYKIVVSITFIIWFIELCVEYYVYSELKLIFLCLLDFALVLIIFKDRLSNKILLYILSYFIVVLSKIITTVILKLPLVTIPNTGDELSNLLINLLLSGSLECTFAILTALYYKKIENIYWTYPLLFLVCLLLTIALPNNNFWYNLASDELLFNIVSIFLILILIALVVQFFHRYNYNIKAQIEKEKTANNYLKKKYEIVENNFKNNLNFLHDMMHDLGLLNDAIEKEDIPLIKENANRLEEHVFKMFNDSLLSNSILSMNLSFFENDIKNKNIKVSLYVRQDLFNDVKIENINIVYSLVFDYVFSQIEDNSILSISNMEKENMEILEIMCFLKKNQVEIIENVVAEIKKYGIDLIYKQNNKQAKLLLIKNKSVT